MEFDSTTATRLIQPFSPNPALKFINKHHLLSSAFPNLPLTVCSNSNLPSSSNSGSSTIERIKYHFVLPSNHEDWLSDFHVVDTQNFKDHFFDDSLHSLMRNGVFVKIREYQNGDLQLSIKHLLPSSENPTILFYEEFKQPFSTPPKESLFSIVQRKLKEWEVEERQLKAWKLEEMEGIFSLPAICVSRVRYAPLSYKSTPLLNVDLCEFNGNGPHHRRFFMHGSLDLDDAGVSFDGEKLPPEIVNKFDELTPSPSKIIAFISTYNQDLYEKLNSHEHAPFIIAENPTPDSIITFPSSISIMNVSVVGELTIKYPPRLVNVISERMKAWEDHCGSATIKKFEFLKPNNHENFEQMRYYIRFLIHLSDECFREMLYNLAPEMLVVDPDFSEFDDYF